MNFELSEEHQAFADSVRRFANDQLAEGAVDKAEAFVLPLFAMAGRGVTDVWTGLWNRPAADAQG